MALNPEGTGGYPGGCAVEVEREHGLSGVQGGMNHFGIMLEGREDYDTVVAMAAEFRGRLVSQCEHGGLVAPAYIANPDGYVVEIQYGTGGMALVNTSKKMLG